jgi:hypothetical protein
MIFLAMASRSFPIAWRLAVASAVCLAGWVGAVQPCAARNRALLMGVAAYDDPAIRPLEGPRNDVLLMWRHLTRSGFAPQDIAVLAEGLPSRADGPTPSGPATRAAILAGFDDLAARSGPGDLVFIHYSGHGTTQPEGEVAEGAEPEPGGRVQALLPKDAGVYDPALRGIRNAVIDKEIGAALDRIRARGARVFVVIDACHAGTVTRAGAGVARSVEARALGVPDVAPATAAPARPLARRASIRGDKAAMVGFFAVDSWNEALERPLPGASEFIGSEGQQKFGIFTWHLARALGQGRARTYRELARLVALDMARGAVAAAPAPMFEGDLDAPLPGATERTAGARFAARVEDGALIVEAGALHGFEPGARVALFDAPVADAKSLGAATLSEAGPASSRAAFAGAAAGPLWAEVETPAAHFRLRVAAAPEAREFVTAAADGAPVDVVDGAADMQASLVAGRLWLTRDGAPPVTDPAAYDRSPSVAIEGRGRDVVEADLRRMLWRFARAANLVRLAAAAEAGGGHGAASARLEILRESDPARLADVKRACVAPLASAPAQTVDSGGTAALGSCDMVRLAIENTGERDLDVGVFFLDPTGEISTPSRDWRQNGCIAFLPAKAARPLVLRTQMRLETATGPGHSGPHRILVFALPRVGGMPANLCHLTQSDPVVAQSEVATLRAGGAKGFAALLSRAGLGDAALRAANPFAEEDDAAAGETSVRQFTLDLRPPR